MPDRYIRAVSVFCGSRSGNDPTYEREATLLGDLLASHGYAIVYGGSNNGLMGALMRGATPHNPSVTAVYPEAFSDASARANVPCAQHFTTASVMDRKNYMQTVTQAAITLPGGIGTFDELLDRACINDTRALIERDQILHPVIICNIHNYFNPLAAQIRRAVGSGFMDDAQRQMFHFVRTAQAAFNMLEKLNKAGPVNVATLRPR